MSGFDLTYATIDDTQLRNPVLGESYNAADQEKAESDDVRSDLGTSTQPCFNFDILHASDARAGNSTRAVFDLMQVPNVYQYLVSVQS